MSSVAAMRDPVTLLLVAVRFIIEEASDPGFPPPIGTAVRLAGYAAWGRVRNEPERGRNAETGRGCEAGGAQRRRRPDAYQVVIVTATGMSYT